MKHVIRLLVVAIIAVGLGFLINGLINKNTALNVENFVTEQNVKIEETSNNIESLRTNYNTSSLNLETFSKLNILFESLKNDFEFYENYLSSTNLTKNEENNIKNGFEKLQTKLVALNDSIKVLSNYLTFSDAEQSPSERDGREKIVNEKFKNVVIECLNLNASLGSVVETKVYDEKCFDAGFNLIEIKNIMIKSFIEKNNGFDFIKGVNIKINNFFVNNQELSSQMKNFSILFNSYSSSAWGERFNEYFEKGEVVSESEITVINFQNMLDLLNLEAYYEKV